jgi:hypothetical protein
MLDGFLARIPQNCGAAWAALDEMMAGTLGGIEEVGFKAAPAHVEIGHHCRWLGPFSFLVGRVVYIFPGVHPLDIA